MNFNENQVIYLQIADHIIDQILLNKWKQDEKIPSVRDLAAELQVNPNTVMRAYDYLQQKEILFNKRGVGNHVSPDAEERILQIRKEQFLKTQLPLLFRNMYLLNIRVEELEKLYSDFVNKNFNPR